MWRNSTRRTGLFVLLSPVNSASKKLGLVNKHILETYLLQNQTRTTFFSKLRVSETIWSSSLAGFGFWLNALSSALLIFDSIEVRFLLLLPIASSEFWLLWSEFLLLRCPPAFWASATYKCRQIQSFLIRLLREGFKKNKKKSCNIVTTPVHLPTYPYWCTEGNFLNFF